MCPLWDYTYTLRRKHLHSPMVFDFISKRLSISYSELDQYEGHWVLDETTGDEGFLDEHEDLFWVYDEDQCFSMNYPFQGRSLRKGGKSKGGQGKLGKSKGKGFDSTPVLSAVPQGRRQRQEDRKE